MEDEVSATRESPRERFSRGSDAQPRVQNDCGIEGASGSCARTEENENPQTAVSKNAGISQICRRPCFTSLPPISSFGTQSVDPLRWRSLTVKWVDRIDLIVVWLEVLRSNTPFTGLGPKEFGSDALRFHVLKRADCNGPSLRGKISVLKVIAYRFQIMNYPPTGVVIKRCRSSR